MIRTTFTVVDSVAPVFTSTPADILVCSANGVNAVVSFTLPASALAGPLSGARVWVTTWDYDGGYRALGPVAQPYAMGGGAAGQPKVMDASAVLTLP